MATMLFDRIVPSGLNAYFPFQMSAASLSPNATVYIANDAAGADSTLASGVSVDDMGGGLYALKVLSANMVADTVYYAVITHGTESVRIPLWAYAPANHIAKVLEDVATVDGVVDDISAELGDVSGQSFTGITAPSTVAAGLAEIFNKVAGVQSDLDNATDGLGALKGLIDTLDGKVTTVDSEVGAMQTDVTAILADTAELQGDWVNGGRLDLLLDRSVVAAEAAEDLIGLAADTSSAATVFGKIAALSGDVATVDGNVDSIKSAIEDGTSGLAALKGHIDDVDTALTALDGKVDTVDTVVDGIASALADGTTGLAALKAEIDANETKLDTIDGVVDGLATEIGDVSAVFGGGSPPETVAAALKAIYDAQQSAADVWDDALDGSDPAGSAGKRLYDLSEDWANGGRLDLILDELTTQGDANETKLDAVIADTEDLQSKIGTPAGASLSADVAAVQTTADAIDSKLGSPAGASVSADIAAIKAVVDTLQVTTNAHMIPSVPSELYSSAVAIRVKVSVTVVDGETGAVEDPDVIGTNGAAQGQVLMIATTIGGDDPALYDAASAGNALGKTNANGLTDWYKMARVDTGFFEAYAELPAYFNKTVEFQFLCFDSDPVNSSQQFFATRHMLVRSPVQASSGGGAF